MIEYGKYAKKLMWKLLHPSTNDGVVWFDPTIESCDPQLITVFLCFVGVFDDFLFLLLK